MIVPMKKVSLVVMDKHREESLKKLRELGVVHLERKNVSSDALSKLLDRKAKTESALGILRAQEAAAKASAKNGAASGSAQEANRKRRAGDYLNPEDAPYSAEALNAPAREDLVLRALTLADERKILTERAALLSKERSRLEGWGSFSPADIELLKNSGVTLYLYEFTLKAFDALPADTRYIVCSRNKTTVRALVLDKEAAGETPFVPGEKSLSEIDSSLAEIHDEAADIDRQLLSLSSRKSVMESELKDLLYKIEFETANTGMELLEDAPAERTVSWITGFAPQEDVGILKRAAAENGWALIADDPGFDDMVPTKLKNNRLASLIKPLTEFLEVVPGYQEADISGWFLLFFTIFFGMIFGDAGYGAILLAAAFIGIFKTMKKGVPPIFKLLLLLAGSNFIWGVLTCTWFGVPVEKLPALLQNISLPLISAVTAAKSTADDAIVRQNLMIICFTLALLQLSIGHIIAITRLRNLKILGELGAMAMIAGMYGIVLALIASNEYRQIPLLMPCVYLLVGGFIVNFMFVNYDGSVGRSIVESLKNIISMILGIANVFSDIMSYIRLWAVGLAGGAISSTVVEMAGPMLGHLAFFIFGIVLLVFGHGLNLVLNVLSVLVHGVRLNTLEFSGHVGLTWAGTAYKPFAERAEKEAAGKAAS